jgi:outer membrane immunogenic protein
VPSSFNGGVQLGDNLMFKNYVFGFVLDYGSLNFSDKKFVINSLYPDDSGNYSINTSINTDWMYTIRGRLGWAPELSWPVMFYGTGGLAVTKLKISHQFTDNTPLEGSAIGYNGNTLNGWNLGLGIEFPIAENLTINGEYLYADFGSMSIQSSVYNTIGGFGIDYQSLVSPLRTTAHLYSNFFKVGLNYKFNPDAVLHDPK